ncbi:hypothetical protein C1X29_05100 [Pseudomonas sp. GW456-12-10-14-LB2]|nr:hypothetical protein C1X29_05100 [Pseudomonas sp. GW456-12-10-14-LB2]
MRAAAGADEGGQGAGDCQTYQVIAATRSFPRRTVCVGTSPWTLCVRSWDAERPGMHSHAERGNDRSAGGAGIRGLSEYPPCHPHALPPEPGCLRRSGAWSDPFHRCTG